MFSEVDRYAGGAEVEHRIVIHAVGTCTYIIQLPSRCCTCTYLGRYQPVDMTSCDCSVQLGRHRRPSPGHGRGREQAASRLRHQISRRIQGSFRSSLSGQDRSSVKTWFVRAQSSCLARCPEQPTMRGSMGGW